MPESWSNYVNGDAAAREVLAGAYRRMRPIPYASSATTSSVVAMTESKHFW